AAAADLRPGVRLVPVHPASAVLDLVAAPLRRPGASAEAVAPLQQQHPRAAQRRLAGRRHSGEPAPHHDHVVHAPSRQTDPVQVYRIPTPARTASAPLGTLAAMDEPRPQDDIIIVTTNDLP